MKHFTLLPLILAITVGSATADDYDVVINNGRVMDPETDFDAVRNVGIKNGMIATITEKKISGKETIDASGHVVAPGFIDTHHHGAGSLWGVKASLRVPAIDIDCPEIIDQHRQPASTRIRQKPIDQRRLARSQIARDQRDR